MGRWAGSLPGRPSGGRRGGEPTQLRAPPAASPTPSDAVAAARAVLDGKATVTPKAGTGPVEAVHQLRIVRAGATEARTAAANQLHSLCDTAPRSDPGPAGRHDAQEEGDAGRTLAARQPTERSTVPPHQDILDDVAPELVAVYGVGYEAAGQLVVSAPGDNPERLRHEQSFAALCSAEPPRCRPHRAEPRDTAVL